LKRKNEPIRPPKHLFTFPRRKAGGPKWQRQNRKFSVSMMT
jgi:hypothetical protein